MLSPHHACIIFKSTTCGEPKAKQQIMIWDKIAWGAGKGSGFLIKYRREEDIVCLCRSWPEKPRSEWLNGWRSNMWAACDDPSNRGEQMWINKSSNSGWCLQRTFNLITWYGRMCVSQKRNVLSKQLLMVKYLLET